MRASRVLSLEDRALGAYLGLAVGDALDATVEFMTPKEIRAQYGAHREIIGGGWLRLRYPHFLPRFVARRPICKWMQGARQTGRAGVLDSTSSTRAERNAADAGRSGAAAGAW